MNAVLAWGGMATGFAVLVAGAWGVQELDIAALGCLTALAFCVAALVYLTASRRLIPALVVVVLYGFAYAPGALDAMNSGISEASIPTTAESVRLAMLAVVLFLCLATGVALWIATRPGAATLTNTVVSFMSAGHDKAFATALLALFAIATVISFRAGFWSYYGGAAAGVTAQSGGFRFELLYESMLLGVFAIAGRHLGRAAWQVPLPLSRVIQWFIPWAVLLVLLFVRQSRRLMVAAVIVTAADPVLLVARAEFRRKIPVMRIVIAAAAGVSLVAGAFFGSALWRTSVDAGGAVSAQWDEQLEDTVTDMASTSIEVEATTRGVVARFTYLWIDSVSIDLGAAAPWVGDLQDVLVAEMAGATPGLLFPGKYALSQLRCEDVFALLGVVADLACTPVTEGVLFGGVLGFFAVSLFFGLGLGIACLVYRQGSDAGLVLSCMMLLPFSIIESGAFPVVHALRGLLVTGGLLATATWLIRPLAWGGQASSSSARRDSNA